ncbi:MAG: DUF4258 domain-containing protein [Rhizobiales bacterium]|nr:DUF4258 domain-containing protein [Hyphomicrobiales bacterium]
MTHKIVPLVVKPQPWKPADAPDEIRRIAKSPTLKLTYREHAIDQIKERDLIVGDVLHALKNGFVYSDAQTTTKSNLFKYLMESKTPNSGNRAIRVVVIPDPSRCWLKVLTVMWVDER